MKNIAPKPGKVKTDELYDEVKKLSDHKRGAMILAQTYQKTDLPWRADWAFLLQQCGKKVVLAEDPETGAWNVAAARFCQKRLCPLCVWRRSVKTFGNVFAIITDPDFLKTEAEFIFLTLTKKNVPAAELSAELDRQLEAWRVLTVNERQPFRRSFLGTFRSLEITYNRRRNDYHVHIHALAAVAPDYFKKSNPLYMSFERLQELWTDALNRAVKIAPAEKILRQLDETTFGARLDLGPTLRVIEKSIREKYPPIDYKPGVRIEKIKKGTHKGVAEVAKYTVKPGDYITSPKVVQTLDPALRHRRLIAYGGIFGGIHKKLKLSDERIAEEDLTGQEAVDVMRNPLIQKIVATWDFSQGAYKIVPYVEDAASNESYVEDAAFNERF